MHPIIHARRPARRATLLAWLALAGCGLGDAVDGPIVDDDRPPASESPSPAYKVHYLTALDFEDGSARVDSTIEFRSMELAFEVPDGALIDYRVLHSGVAGEWRALEADWVEGGHRTAELVIESPADAVELRSDLAPSFTRLAFYAGTAPIPEGELDDHRGDAGDAAPFAARAGRWQPPASVLARGDEQYMPYQDADACWSGNTLRPGARALADFLRARFAGASSYGGYSCRNIVGGSGLSVHATGRAIDLFVPTTGGQADNDLGDPIGNWLIENANYIGISFIIWDRSSWGAHRSRGAKLQAYTGEHPHHDHLHIEISELGAAMGTGWFRDGMPGPGGGCRARPAASCGGLGTFTGTLGAGGVVNSCDERMYLTMQSDGNLVLYQRNVGPLWNSGTWGTAADRAIMQADGNLVVYAGAQPLWDSSTQGSSAFLAVQDDGNLVVYGNGRAQWASSTQARPTPPCAGQWLNSGERLNAGQSRTSCDGRFQLIMQGDGNLVLYQKRVGPVWESATQASGAFAVMQGDGNFVVYDGGGRSIWHTGSQGQGARLAVQSDSNLVIYTDRVLWASNSGECR